MTIRLITMQERLYLHPFHHNPEMRIAVEYQYSDQNYTRFVTYAGQITRIKNGV
jgi:hypothetical protein